VKDIKKAEEIVKKLKNLPHNIKAFAKLAYDFTLDKTEKYNGGYVGYIGKEGMGKIFFDTLWKNKENSLVLKPLKYNDFYHVVYVFKKYEEEQSTLEKEKSAIKKSLLKKDINRWKKVNFQKIKKKTTVKFYNIKF
jgi:parvulin-like peptidyl-prolyl isomerase